MAGAKGESSIRDWSELLQLTQRSQQAESRIVIERVAIPDRGIAIEGAFELPQLARLSADDQVFVIAFLRSHGSIKEMERVFGVSYPTIKSRLSRIANSLEFVDLNSKPSRAEILAQLKRGEINVDKALDMIGGAL